jgi:hypothetical protein
LNHYVKSSDKSSCAVEPGVLLFPLQGLLVGSIPLTPSSTGTPISSRALC